MIVDYINKKISQDFIQPYYWILIWIWHARILL